MDDKTRTSFIAQALAGGAKPLPDSVKRLQEVFCGCGEPEIAWAWVKDYLADLRDTHKPMPPLLSSATVLIAFYLLSHLRFTEHGGSVYHSWLTDAGKELLAFLEEHGADWSEKGEWIDSEGVSHGNFDA